MDESMINSENNRDKRLDNLKEHQFKPGQSGNPKGRPKGPTLKEYARAWLIGMTQEEKDEFLRGLPKETVWKMAEGMPSQDKTVSGTIGVIPLLGGDSNVHPHISDRKAIETTQED